MNQNRTGKSSDYWQTPPDVLKVIRQLGPIELDPCPALDKRHRIARRNIYGESGPGLNWSVTSGLVYINPPYGSKSLLSWITKAANESLLKPDLEVILLAPATPDTKWFEFAIGHCSAFVFWKDRIRFKNATAPAKFPSVFFYFGQAIEPFVKTFAPHGITGITDYGIALLALRNAARRKRHRHGCRIRT